MIIPYDDILKLKSETRFGWVERDTILYSLGIGMPSDPLDTRQLGFVYEQGLVAMPTQVVTLGFNVGVMAEVGYDSSRVLHGEQSITFHKTVPTEGQGTARFRMVGACDKGAEKGAIFSQETVLTLDGDDEPLATLITTSFARADGGFGGPSAGQPAPHAVPDRAPDASVEMPTTRTQALLYRLSGDANPLHVDPDAAQSVGFPEPILHGLCTYAICLRAVLGQYCDYDATLIRSHAVRFSSPVFPGETITVDMWRDGAVVSFEARVASRNVTVIRNGKTVLARENTDA